MPSSLVTVFLTAAAMLIIPAAIIQGRSSRRAGRASRGPKLQPFPAGFAQGAFRAAPGMQPPVLQHAARPRYPAEVSPPVAADVEVLAVIDEDGDVAARVLYAPEPRAPFEREALAAVGRYAFEPGAIDGKPVPVVVTLMVPFRTPLAGRSPARIVGGTADPPPGAASRLVGMADAPGDDIVRPLPLAKVYPGIPGPGAALAGRVEMLIIVNAQGQVAEVDVTRSLAPDFDHAAVAAVRQWVFEPAIRKGGAVPVLLQVFLTIDDEG